MKRLVFILAAVGACALAIAQSPFTIVRPLDGSKVRETVRFDMPKGSIGPSSYIGVFLNGKFVEAVKPSLNGKYYSYYLDTKAAQIPDGPAKVELVLYTDYQDEARIVDRSSVQLIIANTSSIKIPSGGLHIHYRFTPNTELTYHLDQNVKVTMIDAAQARRGGHPSVLQEHDEPLDVLYGVDNAYSDGDGLVRIQLLPPPKKDYLFITTSSFPQGRLFDESQLAPVYMRVTSSGRQVFGAFPLATSFDGSGQLDSTYLYPVGFALPVLPNRPVRPGDSWATTIQLGHRPNNLDLADSLVNAIPARGELVGVEWQMGHPCAHLHNTIQVGSKVKEQASEDIWYAIDKGVVLKMVRTEELVGNLNIAIPQRAAAPQTPYGGYGPTQASPGATPPPPRNNGAGSDFFNPNGGSTGTPDYQYGPRRGGASGVPGSYGPPPGVRGPYGPPVGGRPPIGVPPVAQAATPSAVNVKLILTETYTLRS